MSPRQGGLGPQGRAAVERASEEFRRAPIITETPEAQMVPADEEPLASELATMPKDWYTFDSSRVVEAGYDTSSQRLYVRFVKPQPEGTPWVYEEVPANVWRNFRRSQSPGRFVNRVLNGFPYHRGDFE